MFTLYAKTRFDLNILVLSRNIALNGSRIALPYIFVTQMTAPLDCHLKLSRSGLTTYVREQAGLRESLCRFFFIFLYTYS